MDTHKPGYTLIFTLWFGYVFFVVYGSLVPLDFRGLPFDQAWAIFRQIPMYKLGVESRADWISNGVLYVPVGFLTAHLLIQKLSEARRTPLLFLAGLFSVALAFSVEFTQIFFPPRTVSLNDLLAETVGGLVGLVLAVRYTDWFKILLHAVVSNPRRLTLRLVEAYLAGYVAFSLFPFDVLISSTEFEQKLLGDNWGWLLAGDPHGKVMVIIKGLSEVVLTLPFGLFLCYRSIRGSATYKQATWLGFMLGGFIEIAQLFTATGVSQGLSVVTRIAGFCGGLALWRHREKWTPDSLLELTRRYALLLSLTYLFLILQANGWFSHRWNGTGVAVDKLADLHFLPFYYHYFTTEAKALFSLASVCMMYIPIGLLVWSRQGSPSQAFFAALVTASVIESGKLFLQGMHSDPTNILLGAIAGWGTVYLARVFAEAATMAPSDDTLTSHGKQNPAQRSQEQSLTVAPADRWESYIVLALSLIFVSYWVATFPVEPFLLGLLLAVCAVIIWRRPVLIVAIIPAALPILDLAPWSGRFYLDEFDLLLLLSLAIGYARVPFDPHHKIPSNTAFTVAAGLFALSFAISAMRGLTPWQALDANSFTNYYSPFNALRIVKGALWAFLSYGLLTRFASAQIDIKGPLTSGVLWGLAMTVTVIIWERLTFSDLFDFTSDYRITGPFSSMHMGGAYIECFLAIATPFLIVWILQTRCWVGKLAGIFLLLATTYALMVTFSRNGYSAFGIAVGIILFFSIFKSGRWQRRRAFAAVLGGAMLAVALPVFTGQFAQDRIANAGKDYSVRLAHWEDALNIRSTDLLTILFGMGLGRYPESHYLLSNEASHAGTYQVKTEAGSTFLRLGAGDPIYVEQIISIDQSSSYLLKLDVRTTTPGAKIAVSLCEKWLLTSFNCVQIPLSVGNETGTWQSVEAAVTTELLGGNPWYARKPVKFALHNPRGKTLVDIGRVRLETSSGENLLVNGDFSNEMDHWFFSADSHLQWHAKSLPVAILFDQGWFGLMALSFFSILAIMRATGHAWRGDIYGAAALASFCGFLVVGLFDTLIDAPRFLFLFLLLGGYCGFMRPSEIGNRKNG